MKVRGAYGRVDRTGTFARDSDEQRNVQKLTVERIRVPKKAMLAELFSVVSNDCYNCLTGIGFVR